MPNAYGSDVSNDNNRNLVISYYFLASYDLQSIYPITLVLATQFNYSPHFKISYNMNKNINIRTIWSGFLSCIIIANLQPRLCFQCLNISNDELWLFVTNVFNLVYSSIFEFLCVGYKLLVSLVALDFNVVATLPAIAFWGPDAMLDGNLIGRLFYKFSLYFLFSPIFLAIAWVSITQSLWSIQVI